MIRFDLRFVQSGRRGEVGKQALECYVTGSKNGSSIDGGAVRKQMIKKRYEEKRKEISNLGRKEQMLQRGKLSSEKLYWVMAVYQSYAPQKRKTRVTGCGSAASGQRWRTKVRRHALGGWWWYEGVEARSLLEGRSRRRCMSRD